MLKNKKLNYTSIILIIITIGVVFFDIFKLFYQQDEWAFLGTSIGKGTLDSFLSVFLPPRWYFGEGRVLSQIFGYYLITLHPFNTIYVALYSYSLHILNSVLVYLLAKRLLKNNQSGIIASLIFGISGVSYSAVLWFGTSIGTLASTFLILLSLLFFCDGIQNNSLKKAIISYVLLYLSVLFKEVGIYLFVIYPLIWLFIKKKNYLFNLLPLSFFALGIFSRVFALKTTVATQALFLTGNTYSFWSKLLLNTIFYPIISFSQMFIPPKIPLFVSTFVAKVYYPDLSSLSLDLVSQTVVLDMLFLAVSILFLTFIWKNKFSRILAIISMSSFLPYVVITKGFSYLDSRHFYLPLVFGSILVGSLVLGRTEAERKIIKCFVLIFLLANLIVLRTDMKGLVNESVIRKDLVKQILELNSQIKTNNNVIILTSDKEYYSPNNRLPFQNGSGYIFMTLDYNRGYPQNFYDSFFLWEINSEGYKKEGEMGFGYFNSEKSFEKFDIKDRNKINQYRYHYESGTNKLIRK